MQEFDAVKAQLSALGVRVRSVVCQHGDIPAMLARRGCELDFVELVSDPDFSICKDYLAKGMELIFAEEERDMLLTALVEKDGFESKEAAKHNMVQPAICVEDDDGNVVYKWSWHDVGTVGQYWNADGTQVDDTFVPMGDAVGESKSGADVKAGTHSHIVPLRPTTDSILAALQSGSFENIEFDSYTDEWKRPGFPFNRDGAQEAAL